MKHCINVAWLSQSIAITLTIFTYKDIYLDYKTNNLNLEQLSLSNVIILWQYLTFKFIQLYYKTKF
jgi:hypothetical protein